MNQSDSACDKVLSLRFVVSFCLFQPITRRFLSCLDEGSDWISRQRTSFAEYTTILRKKVAKTSWNGVRDCGSKTGYSRSTVQQIVAEKLVLEGDKFESPCKRYKVSRKQIVVDDFDAEALRRSVYEFYKDKKYPTLDSLLDAAKQRRRAFLQVVVPHCGRFWEQ